MFGFWLLISAAVSGDLHSNFEAIVSSREGVVWDSRIHNHRFDGSKTAQIVQRNLEEINRAYLQSPRSVQLVLATLSNEIQEKLAVDSLDSRTDPIDLLSVRLKEELQKQWEETWGHERYTYDKSELWSLAKYRWKKIILPSIQLETGVSVFRSKESDSRSALFVCGDPKVRWRNANIISQEGWGEIIFSEVVIPQNRVAEWQCGERRFTVEWEAVGSAKTGSLNLSADRLPLENAFESGRLQIVSVLGITETISERTLSATKKFLKYWGGYDIANQSQVSLKETLEKLILDADIFAPLSDVPNANRFTMSFKGDKFTKIEVTKSVDHPSKAGGKVEVNLTILLPPPPTHRPAADAAGVSFEFQKFVELMKERAKHNKQGLIIFDLACFSKKYMGNWLSLYTAAGTQEPWMILSSENGHQGEDILQILFQMDSILRGFEMFAQDQSLSTIREQMHKASWVSRLGSRVARWFGKDVSSEFELVSHHDVVWPSRPKFLKVSSDSGVRLYAPNLP